MARRQKLNGATRRVDARERDAAPRTLATTARGEEVRQAAAKVAAMTPAEKQAMIAEQRQSWVRGELGMMEPKPKFKIVNGVKVYESLEDFWND